MPPISPCGRAVDFARSCFQGFWRFFAGRPDIVTKGRLYRTPATTPTLAVPHFFGSGHWRDDDGFADRSMGQAVDLGEKWDSGTAPQDIPPFTFARDGQFQEPILYDKKTLGVIQAGFDKRCFTGFDPGVDIFVDEERRPDIIDCCWQRFWARIMEMYTGTAATRQVAREVIDSVYSLDFERDDGLGPGGQGRLIRIRGPRWNIIVLTGTDNWTELFREILHGGSLPVRQGNFRTSLHWNHRCNQLIDMLPADDDFWSKGFTLIGHSQGGVILYLLAARMFAADNTRDLKILTYGCPKPGDNEVINVLPLRFQRHLKMRDDLVPHLPPTQQEAENFVQLLGRTRAANFGVWRSFREYQMLHEDNDIFLGPLPELPLERLREVINLFLRNQPPQPIVAHEIRSYQLRLRACCREPFPPLDPDQWDRLFGENREAAGGLKWGGHEYRLFSTTSLSLALGGGGQIAPSSPPYGFALGGHGSTLTTGGGFALGGAGAFPAGPGPTCLTAGTLPLDENQTFTIAVLEHNWWKFNAGAGQQYYVKLLLNSGSGLGASVFRGADCASLFLLFNLDDTLNICNTHTPLLDTTIWIDVFGGLLGPTNYTLKAGEGPCPP